MKMTKKQYEKLALDKRIDKKLGAKENSAKDNAADKMAMRMLSKGAKPGTVEKAMTRGAGMKNLNRAEPRLGAAFGQDTKLYHKMRGNAGKARRMGYNI